MRNVWDKKAPVDGIAADPIYLDLTVPAGRRKSLPAETTRHGLGMCLLALGSSATLLVRSLCPQNRSAGWIQRPHPKPKIDRSCCSGRGDELMVQAGEDGIRFLLVSGKPLQEPVAWYGPIVMSLTSEELRKSSC